MLKLVVDGDRKAFRLILVIDKPMLTAAYDSSTARWRLCHDRPDLVTLECYAEDSLGRLQKFNGLFVWRNEVYAYSRCGSRYRCPVYVVNGAPFEVVAFNKASMCWRPVWASSSWALPRFPGVTSFQTNYLVSSVEDEVVLSMYSISKKRPFLRAYKLVDNERTFASAPRYCWQIILTGSYRGWDLDIKKALVGPNARPLPWMQLGHLCYGTDYMCFMFRRDCVDQEGSMPHACLKYAFATSTWSMVPCPKGWAEPFKLFHWQPNVAADLFLVAQADLRPPRRQRQGRLAGPRVR